MIRTNNIQMVLSLVNTPSSIKLPNRDLLLFEKLLHSDVLIALHTIWQKQFVKVLAIHSTRFLSFPTIHKA